MRVGPASTATETVAGLLRLATGAQPDRGDLLGRLARHGHLGTRAAMAADHALATLRGGPSTAHREDFWVSWSAVLDACADATPVWLIDDAHLASPDLAAFLRHAQLADVTGDGRADAIRAARGDQEPVRPGEPLPNDNGVVVRRSNGSRFLPPEIWTDIAFFGDRLTAFEDVTGG